MAKAVVAALRQSSAHVAKTAQLARSLACAGAVAWQCWTAAVRATRDPDAGVHWCAAGSLEAEARARRSAASPQVLRRDQEQTVSSVAAPTGKGTHAHRKLHGDW